MEKGSPAALTPSFTCLHIAPVQQSAKGQRSPETDPSNQDIWGQNCPLPYSLPELDSVPGRNQ